MNIGKSIQTYRKKLKLSQVELSKLTGLKQATISAIENDVNKPSMDTILLISKALGCTVSELIGDERKNNLYSQKEVELIELFRLLNAKGQLRTFEMIQTFSMLPEYQRSGTDTEENILAFV